VSLLAPFFSEYFGGIGVRNEQNSRNVQLVELTPTATKCEELVEKMHLIERLAQKARLQSDDLFDFKEQDFPKIETIRGKAR
jgi:hypothetical protein